MTGAGYEDELSRQVIDNALANFDFYPSNAPELSRIVTNEDTRIDFSEVFYNTTGNDVVLNVESIDDPSLFTAYFDGNELVLSTQSEMGNTRMLIKGTAGTRESFLYIKIEVYNPSLYNELIEDFETEWPVSGWTLQTTGAGWARTGSQSVSGSYSAIHYDDEGAQNDWLWTPLTKINGNAYLSFWQKGAYVDYYDTHGVAQSLNMNRYTWLEYDLPVSEDWEIVYIDLGAYDGQEIYLGFNYQGDYSDVWMIDDVRVLSPTSIEGDNLIEGIELLNNYPNPFNPTTQISFNVDRNANVKLSVLNSRGQEVAKLHEGRVNRGNHKFDFNAAYLNSGIYFYRLECGDFSDTKKMILIK